MTAKVKLIPSYEAIMPLLLENYCRNTGFGLAALNEREKMMQDVFIPLAKAADKYYELQEELKNV